MGRPINKRFFGNPAETGSQFSVTFGAGQTTGWIVKQLGAKRFRCTDDTITEDCILSLEPTVEGTMNMTIETAQGPQLVSKISGRTATVADGTRVKWNAGAIEGGPVISITELVAGVEYQIVDPGDSVWSTVGATSGIAGEVFIATGPGTGSGTAAETVQPAVKPKAEPAVEPVKEEPKKSVVEKVTEAVKDIVQDKPKVEEPKKSYKPRAKKAPAKKTTRARKAKDSEE